MAIRTLSIWDDVPDADKLKDMLGVARNRDAPVSERQYAVSYLTGVAKVLAGIEKRKPLADYLARQLKAIKANLYYTSERKPHADEAHG